MTIKEYYEKEKIKLEILRNNFERLIENSNMKDKFFYALNDRNVPPCYEVEQNLSSPLFLFNALKYPNAKTCFLVEAFNYFQDLPIKTDYPYCSYSQILTTYCLKMLDKEKFIDIKACFLLGKEDLESYMEMLGNYDYKKKEVKMYDVYFYKLCSLGQKDVPFAYKLMSKLGADSSILKVYVKDEKIYFGLKKNFLCKQWLTGEIFRNSLRQKEFFIEMLIEFYETLFKDDTSRKRER